MRRHGLGRADHPGHPIVLGQNGIGERVAAVQHVEHRAVVAHDVGDEPYRLFEHRGAQLVAELGEALAIDRVVLVEAPEVEPVAAELRGQAARALVLQHPADLSRAAPIRCAVRRRPRGPTAQRRACSTRGSSSACWRAHGPTAAPRERSRARGAGRVRRDR